MDIADFDAWRAEYDGMSYADQQEFYDLLEAEHGTQAGYNAKAYARLLNFVGQKLPWVYVAELGGWKGELACEMLERFPDIKIWCNVEISQAAVKKSVHANPRYATWVPDDFIWRVELPLANVLIASHFIEHIRAEQVAALFERLPATMHYIGLQAPIESDTPSQDWTGYHGSHILEIGWRQVNSMLGGVGFGEIGALRDKSGHGEFRAYVRY